jgi:hypothetical protein
MISTIPRGDSLPFALTADTLRIMFTPNGRGWSMTKWRIPATLVAAIALSAQFAVLGAQTCRGCAGDDTLRRIHILPGVGLRVGAPQKASVALGMVIGQDWQRDGHDHSRNVGVFAEPGLAGGRASVAYLSHGYGSFGSGLGVAASVLRTWRDPWWAKGNVTYAGGEVILWPIVFFGPRVGVFRSVSRVTGPDTKRWMVTLDFGFGL